MTAAMDPTSPLRPAIYILIAPEAEAATAASVVMVGTEEVVVMVESMAKSITAEAMGSTAVVVASTEASTVATMASMVATAGEMVVTERADSYRAQLLFECCI